MKSKRLLILPSLVLTLLAGVPTAKATSFSMPLDGTWVVLSELGTAPFFFTGGGTGTGTWDWTSTRAVSFFVTDLFAATDRYEIYDNGFSLGESSFVADDTSVDVSDPDLAASNAAFSKFSYTFAAGSHSISIKNTRIPVNFNGDTYIDGTVAFRATTVPDAGTTVILLGLALTGLAFVRRRIA